MSPAELAQLAAFLSERLALSPSEARRVAGELAVIGDAVKRSGYIKRKTPLPGPAKPISRRTRIKRKPARRIARETATEKAYKAWVHSQPCCGEDALPSHRCCHTRDWNPIEQSHERDMTGLGLKSSNFRSVAMCRALHQQWEQHRINFKDWTTERRKTWMAERIIEANARFNAEQARRAA